jgi:hypothetical protein
MKRSKHSENFKLNDSTSVEAKLWAALHNTVGGIEQKLGNPGEIFSDQDVKQAIASEFGGGGGSTDHGGFRYKGGAHPALEDANDRVILSGKGLIQKTRKLLNLDDPTKNTVTLTAGGKSVTVDEDKFASAAKAAARIDADAETTPRKSRIPKAGMTPNFVTESCPPVLAGKTCWKMASPFLRRLGQKLINDIPEHRHLCEARILLLVKQTIDLEKKDDNPAGPKSVHLGKAGKSGPRDRLLSLFIPDSCHADDRLPIDFWIWVNGDWLETLGVKTERDGETHWTEGSLDIDAAGANKITALLDHELSHCGILIKGTFVFPKSLKAFIDDLGPRHVETCMEVVDKKGRVLVRYHAQDKDLNPVWKMRHHEVEDFVGVLARHGAWTEDLCRMIDEMTPPKDPDLLDSAHDKVPA